MKNKLFFRSLTRIQICCILSASLFFTGCWYKDFYHEEQITDVYYLIALDGDDVMSIMCQDSDGNYGSYVIASTVFAVGYNEDFIIVKHHPHWFAEPIDKSITNYFIIPLKNKVSEFPYDNKIGPLTLEQFNEKRKELNIPKELKFTIEFEDLK
jgi:hypothetical protein